MKKLILFVLLSIVLVSCEKEEVETGSVTVRLSLDFREGTIGVFDMASLKNNIFDPRTAIKTQKITSSQVTIDGLLPMNYVVGIIEYGNIYIKVTQVQKGKVSEVTL